jgi:hypothetical protein
MAFPASCFCHVKSAALKTLLNNFQRLTKTQNLRFTSVLNSNKLTLSSPHSPSLTYPIKTIFTSSISCNPNDSLPQTKDGTEEQRPDLSRDVSPADDIRSQAQWAEMGQKSWTVFQDPPLMYALWAAISEWLPAWHLYKCYEYFYRLYFIELVLSQINRFRPTVPGGADSGVAPHHRTPLRRRPRSIAGSGR